MKKLKRLILKLFLSTLKVPYMLLGYRGVQLQENDYEIGDLYSNDIIRSSKISKISIVIDANHINAYLELEDVIFTNGSNTPDLRYLLNRIPNV